MRAARALATVLAATTAAATVTACGGSGRLSRQQLHDQASAICTRAGTQTTRIATPASPPASQAFLAKGIRVLAPELTQLRKLQPPSDVADVYSTAISSFAKKLDYLKSAQQQLAAGQDPIGTMRTLQTQLAPTVSQENGAWQALGIPACANR